ncbi:hypothetical protein GCM10012287_15010 [Streptomyces daqingensis]|uniref:Peptidase S11 D-alanyl-D-alanine carboxypeptidase A N-terminal domain-containing protein n=1 Tax=Streptomyces daqingensis TaxID=1472640 RepID=A0ABQ2M1L4_9ACTN|nr:D-alanyl-D-alanine carboxypeptidase [Streptomyces daqingensis]GGO45919.1 hypothetical protein GCM10012287_15010 [Streptomyces daqingensis]
MAGESPDKVERGKSSGETTDEGRPVASSRGKKSGSKSPRQSGNEARTGTAPSKSAKSSKPRPAKGGATAKPAKSRKGGKPGGGTKSAAAPKSSKPAKSTDTAPGEGAPDAASPPAEGSSPEPADASSAAPEAAPAADGAAVAATSAGADEQASSAAPAPGDEADAGASGEGGDSAGAGDEAGQPAGHGHNDERLKAAVAAWVAGSGDEPDGQSRRERGDSAAGEGKTSQSAEGVDNPTAMFRTVDADSVRSEEEDSEAAARRAERMTSAFFGPGRSAKQQGSGDADAAAEPSSAPATADGAVTDGEAADSEEPESASPGRREPGAAEPVAEEAEQAGAEKAGEAVAGEAVDAESGAETPDGAAPGEEASNVRSREDAEGTAAPAAGPSGGTEAEPPAPAGPGAPRVDEPTAVFRTPAAQEPAGAAARGDQPTAVFRTVEPGKADEAPDAEKADAEKSEAAKPGEAEPEAGKSEAGKSEAGKSGAGKSREDEPGSGDSGAGLKGDAKTETLPEPRDKDATTQLVRPVDPRLAVAADAGTGKLPAQKKEPETGADGESKGAPAGERAGAPEKAPEKTSAKAPAKSSEEESDSERTSQFVPLRSADAPPRPTRKPDPAAPPKPLGRPAAPAAGELPAEAPAAGLSEAERTRQEVRPDQAPLDLLAQLTNTPPPPETPLRTAVRRVKIWTPLVVLLVVLFAVAQAVRPLPEAELALTASPTHTFQGPKPSVPWPSEGQARLDVQGLGSFGSSGKQKPVPIASVAKVMTAYVILREHPVKKGTDGASIPVDRKAEEEAGLSAQNESTVEVEEGDKISQREAVQALMIASANNVARLLARWDAGSEKAFAKKMNAAADDLGMKNTHYTDPSGLTATTVSTAEDQVKLAKKAMGIDLFREIVRLPGYRDAKGEEHGNWNKLVPVDGVVGIKTGTTTKAGGNLLFAAEEEIGGTKQLIVGAVLGQYRPSILDTVLQESKKLIDTAQDALRAQKVVRKGEVVGYVDDQLGGRTPVVATRDVTAVGWSGLKVKLAMTDGGKPLPHEGSRGDRAGTLTVGDGPGQVRVPLALKEDMAEPGFGAKLTRIL